jgi:hypothetical protein
MSFSPWFPSSECVKSGYAAAVSSQRPQQQKEREREREREFWCLHSYHWECRWGVKCRRRWAIGVPGESFFGQAGHHSAATRSGTPSHLTCVAKRAPAGPSRLRTHATDPGPRAADHLGARQQLLFASTSAYQPSVHSEVRQRQIYGLWVLSTIPFPIAQIPNIDWFVLSYFCSSFFYTRYLYYTHY